MTLREARELQALAQIALPAVREGRPLRCLLPCKADRYRLRAAIVRLHEMGRGAAVEYLARGGDPLP